MCQGTGLDKWIQTRSTNKLSAGKKEQSKKTKPVSNVQKIRYGLKHHVLLLSVSVPHQKIKARGNRQDGGHNTSSRGVITA